KFLIAIGFRPKLVADGAGGLCTTSAKYTDQGQWLGVGQASHALEQIMARIRFGGVVVGVAALLTAGLMAGCQESSPGAHGGSAPSGLHVDSVSNDRVEVPPPDVKIDGEGV